MASIAQLLCERTRSCIPVSTSTATATTAATAGSTLTTAASLKATATVKATFRIALSEAVPLLLAMLVSETLASALHPAAETTRLPHLPHLSHHHLLDGGSQLHQFLTVQDGVLVRVETL
jgi:hypothetical protein